MATLFSKIPKTLFVFYLLVFYIFAQFVWWAYLIVNLNIELASVSDQLVRIPSKVWMVLGEGAVFLTLLFLGFRQVKKSFLKEVLLSRQQNNFLLSITHELNSPLASIKLNLQTMLKRVLDSEKQNKLLQAALDEVTRQEKLVNNILLAARAENNNYQLVFQKIDLVSFIQNIIARYQNQSTHVFEFDSPSNTTIQADDTALNIILSNLLENAIKYSPEKTTIRIQLFDSKEEVRIKISDEGQGIAEEDSQNIFDKFYRSGNEETRKSKGTGLGLYLAKFFTEALNGKIKYLPQSKGACFELRFQKV
jgi:two-component system, OmpR family, phosphate regulon sensor histidine kinase PhoR